MSLPSSYLDRFLLGYFIGTGAVGVLAVARQLQQLPAAVYQMLLSVASPMFAGAHARDASSENEHLYALTTDWAVRTALPLIVFLAFFAWPVLTLFGPGFAQVGTIPLQVFMFAQFFNLASGPNGNMAMMSGLEREAFRIDIATMTGVVVLLAALIPMLGLLGVALSSLANSIATNIATLLLVRARLGIRWWNERYLRWLLPTICTAGAGLILRVAVAVWSPLELGIVLIGVYVVFGSVSLLQGLHQDDLELLRHIKQKLAFS